MRAEMAPFGTHVTARCPGFFRTDWAARSMIRTEHTIEEYDTQAQAMSEAWVGSGYTMPTGGLSNIAHLRQHPTALLQPLKLRRISNVVNFRMESGLIMAIRT